MSNKGKKENRTATFNLLHNVHNGIYLLLQTVLNYYLFVLGPYTGADYAHPWFLV